MWRTCRTLITASTEVFACICKRVNKVDNTSLLQLKAVSHSESSFITHQLKRSLGSRALNVSIQPRTDPGHGVDVQKLVATAKEHWTAARTQQKLCPVYSLF